MTVAEIARDGFRSIIERLVSEFFVRFAGFLSLPARRHHGSVGQIGMVSIHPHELPVAAVDRLVYAGIDESSPTGEASTVKSISAAASPK